MESILSEYEASLNELSFNSKPHINMLTILAEENVNYASDIVKIIEKRLLRVQLKRKIPVLYLIDSIVKNFGNVYQNLFSKNLILIFLNIFDKADGKIRGDLYKLRSTWDNTFPERLLRKLDETVRQLDHNWPMRSRKHSHSRNPLGLGDSPPHPKFSSNQDIHPGGIASFREDVEEVIEEEEIELDDESLGALEMLEEKLKKKQAELNRLEYLESTQKEDNYNLPGKFEEPDTIAKTDDQSEDDDELKIDLNEYPVIPMEPLNLDLENELENSEVDGKEAKPQVTNHEESLVSHHRSAALSGVESRLKRRNHKIFQQLDKNRVISHFPVAATPQAESQLKEDTSKQVPENSPPEAPQRAEATYSTATQTQTCDTDNHSVQCVAEMKDECTQYRYRKKTKNFMSQYRVPSKTIGTYFKIKTKDSETQYDPPSNCQDTAADSTCLPLDDDVAPHPHTKVAQTNHSLHILRSLRQQRDLGMLCDITLAAQGEAFKAHKSLLVACSDFFHTLFASDEIKQTPLSFIELQGITASALSLVLDYIYTSEVVVGANIKSVHEIITAAKRLKIQSLYPVCEVLEEALQSEQDITGWVISNTELIAPTNDLSHTDPDSTLPPSTDELTPEEDALSDSDVAINRVSRAASTSPQTLSTKSDLQAQKKHLKRSSSQVQHVKKSVKRKERSQSLVDTPQKRKKSDDKSGEKTFCCQFCTKKFWKEKNLRFHKKKMHFDIETQANDSTNDSKNAEQQTNAVTLDAAHSCKHCSRSFKNADQLSGHIKKHHRADRVKRPKSADGSPAEKLTNSRSEPEVPSGAKTTVQIKSVKDFTDGEPKAASENKEKWQKVGNPDPRETSNAQLRIYQCEICEEIFSVQCFFKAHMASHRQNAEIGVM